MNNLRLTSLLSVALLFSYVGNTICMYKKFKQGIINYIHDENYAEQFIMNSLVVLLTWGSLEAANQTIDEKISCYKYIHYTTKLARRNLFLRAHHSWRLDCLKYEDPDNSSVVEAIVETGGAMGTSRRNFRMVSKVSRSTTLRISGSWSPVVRSTIISRSFMFG